MRNLLLLLLCCCFSKTDAQVFKELDQNTRIDSMIQYHIGFPEPIFRPYLKEEWKWYKAAKPLEQIQYQMNYRDSIWIPMRRFTWNYHPLFDEEIAETNWQWSDSLQRWKPISRDSSIYNTSGQAVKIVSHYFNSSRNEWILRSSTDIFYNLAGKKEKTIYTAADTSRRWPIISTFKYTYGNNGELRKIDGFYQPLDSAVDIHVLTTNFSYSPPGRIVREEEFTLGPDLRKQMAYSSVYDAQGRLIEFIEDRGSVDGSQWITRKRRVYVFDNQGKFKRESIEGFNRQTQSWSQYAYWEIHGELFEEEPPNYSSSLFEICPLPNPMSNEAPFVCSKLAANALYQLRVLDLQGRLVFEKEFAGDELVYWAKGLSAGLYLLGIGPKDKGLRYQKFLLE